MRRRLRSHPVWPGWQAAPSHGAPAREFVDEYPPTWPWKGVRWSLSLVGFMLYIFVIISYEVNLGDVAIITALVALPFSGVKPRLPQPLALFGLFILWGAVGYAVSDYRDVVWGRLEDLGKLWIILFIAYNLIRTPVQLRMFLIYYLACFALYPLRGAYFNYFIYHGTTAGRVAWNHIFSNPNDLSAFSFLPLGLCAGLLGLERQRYLRWCAIAGCLMIPLMIFLTQSRGGILALGVFGLLMLMARGRRLAMLGIGVGATIVVAIYAPSSVWDRLRGLENVTNTEDLSGVDKEGSAEQRYEIWKVARAIAIEHPVFGVGVGAYPQAHFLRARSGEFKPTARGLRDAHSTYFTLLAETGVLGAALYAGIFIAAFARAESVRRRIRLRRPKTAQQLYFLEAGTAAMFAAGVFGSYAHLPFMLFHSVFLWLIADVAGRYPSWGALPNRQT